MTEIGLIGCGYWGPNLLRNFYELPGCSVVMVADIREERLAYVRRRYSSVETTKDHQDLLKDPDIDGIVIATPALTHYSLAKECLQSDKHVLVEKPLAMTSAQAMELIELAQQAGKVLMVSHTFEYNAAVRKLKEYVVNGELGDIYYVYSARLNLGKVRDDVNVMWSLAPHDVSILLYLLEATPVRVMAKGMVCIQEGIEDVVFMVLDFPNNVTAHIHVSWLDPSKVRRMTVVGSKKMIIYDDVSEMRIRIYDKGITKGNIKEMLGEYDTFGKFQLIQRAGDIHIPKIDFIEPLQLECAEFIECIEQGRSPLSDGYDGYRVVKVLEAAQRSLQNGGLPEVIPDD